MSTQKDNMYYGQFVKKDGELQPFNSGDAARYKEFIASLAEGQIVDRFEDANVDDATLAQLAKVHKCIRELSLYTGNTFVDMKNDVKANSGLCVEKELEDEMYIIRKSFGKCSKDEIGLVIQALIEMGDINGINFR